MKQNENLNAHLNGKFLKIILSIKRLIDKIEEEKKKNLLNSQKVIFCKFLSFFSPPNTSKHIVSRITRKILFEIENDDFERNGRLTKQVLFVFL